MRRVVLALAVVAGMLFLTPSPSWACSCAMSTTEQQVRAAVTVAAGTVAWTATDGETRTYRIDVDSVYKGAAASSEKLLTSANEASCGLGSLATGRRYLFFIEGRHPGEMRIGLCGGTVAYAASRARQVESVTGPPGKPLVVRAVAADRGDSSGTTALVAAGAALVLVAAAATAFGLRRRG